jgi:hypothetical protein
MSTSRQKGPAFNVGDRVQFLHAGRNLPGIVIQDRGPVGIGGRRLYRVAVPDEPFDPVTFVMPEEELELGESPAAKRQLLTTTKIVDYLRSGGLEAILMSANPHGQEQPRVWLCLDTHDNVTHTFRPEHGMVGGATVPAVAPSGDLRASEETREPLTNFLAHFGLSPGEAEDVIEAVGSRPAVRTRPRKTTNRRRKGS